MSRPRLGYRWTVCALLFVVTTINYVDRQVLGILAPTLQRELWGFSRPRCSASCIGRNRSTATSSPGSASCTRLDSSPPGVR